MLSFASANSSFIRNFARVYPPAKLIEKDFHFSSDAKVKAILAKYPEDRKRSGVIPLLHLGQQENGGYISKGVIKAVADITGAPFGRVHETATFYSMFRFVPPNKHVIEACKGLSCYLRGSDNVKKTIEDVTGGSFAKGGSSDGEFTLQEVECLGACANSPVVIIDGVYYQDLTSEKIKTILEDIKSGANPNPHDAIHTPPARSLLCSQ